MPFGIPIRRPSVRCSQRRAHPHGCVPSDQAENTGNNGRTVDAAHPRRIGHALAHLHIQQVRLHDLRHTYASLGISLGLSLPIVGATLGHQHMATTQRYAHLAQDPVQEGAERIAEAMEGRFESGPMAEITLITKPKKCVSMGKHWFTTPQIELMASQDLSKAQ